MTEQTGQPNLAGQEIMLECFAHPTEFGETREPLHVYCAVPNAGVDADTGVLLMALGFAKPAETRLYQKMRRTLADQFNVVCVGVNYLGTNCLKGRKISIHDFDRAETHAHCERTFGDDAAEIIAGVEDGDLNTVLYRSKGLDLRGILYMQETLKEPLSSDFSDYGLVQALDMINAIGAVRRLFGISEQRIFAVGSSLGGYVLQMVNKLAPRTLSSFIDVSSPAHLHRELFLRDHVSNGIYDANNTSISFARTSKYSHEPSDPFFLSEDMFEIREVTNPNHYRHGNTATILMLHGTEDREAALAEKVKQFGLYRGLGIVAHLIPVGIYDLDGRMFKHAGHSLGSHWLTVIEKFGGAAFRPKTGGGPSDFGLLARYDFETRSRIYTVTYEADRAHLTWRPRI